MIQVDEVLADAAVAGPRRAAVTPVGPVSRTRIVTGLVFVSMVTVAVVATVELSSGRRGHDLLAVALGLALVPLVASPIEWFVHRFVYHQAAIGPLRPIFVVHTAHHFAFYPTWRYVTAGPARRLAIRSRAPDVHTTRSGNARVRLAHFGWYMAFGFLTIWTPAWFATGDIAFLGGLILASAVVANLFIVVHDTIHRPGSHRLVEAQPWYAFLDRHHYIHHIDLGANLNFLLPLADSMFGTLRTQLSAEELAGHGPLEHAKARPVGHGERATISPTPTHRPPRAAPGSSLDRVLQGTSPDHFGDVSTAASITC